MCFLADFFKSFPFENVLKRQDIAEIWITNAKFFVHINWSFFSFAFLLKHEETHFRLDFGCHFPAKKCIILKEHLCLERGKAEDKVIVDRLVPFPV